MCKDQNTVVSVIIPTFNVEKYVEQCLRSLLEQTFREFEVICVDDGFGWYNRNHKKDTG